MTTQSCVLPDNIRAGSGDEEADAKIHKKVVAAGVVSPSSLGGRKKETELEDSIASYRIHSRPNANNHVTGSG